jgi:uncharacterized protein
MCVLGSLIDGSWIAWYPYSPNMDDCKNTKLTHRLLGTILSSAIQRGQNILLLGPRQTGKSTLIRQFPADLFLNFLLPSERLRFEKAPELLLREIAALPERDTRPLIILDEVQKVPSLMDVVQYVIDESKAQCILSGSSARKLKRGKNVNLLPGRVLYHHLDPLTHREYPQDLESHLLFGSLPQLATALTTNAEKEAYLRSYVETYLEEEVRQEALVRDLGSFARFLGLAAVESGRLVSYRGMSNELGPTHTTIASYYEVLQDCLIMDRVDPITKSATRKKLTKSSRFLFFDLGVRRVAAGEGYRLSNQRLGELFEQYVGLELLRYMRLGTERAKLYFWRDHDGPEVDWVIAREGEYIPIEVKWSETPQQRDGKHVELFLNEYPEAQRGYIVCRTPRAFTLKTNITCIPWQELPRLFYR